MSVACPHCGTRNEVVASHLRAADHLMTCISCGGQFTVGGDSRPRTIEDFGDDVTGVDLDTLDNRSRSVRIPLDQVDWAEAEDSMRGSSDSLGPIAENARRSRQSISLPSSMATPSAAEQSGSGGLDGAYGAGDRWGWRDLPLALMAVFDRRRLLVAVLGLWAVFATHGLVAWFAGWAATRNAGLGTLFSLLAAAIFLALFVVVSSVCSVMCHTDLIEERPIDVRDAIQWTRNWIQSVLGTPLSFVAVVASVVIIEAVFGFIGRIPYAGPPLWGVLAPVTLVCSLIGGLAVVCLAYSLPIYIPVIYNERTNALDTLNRLLELLRQHGARIVSYLLGSLAMTAAAAGVVLMPAWFLANQLTTRVGTATMGPALGQTLADVPAAFAPGTLLFLNAPLVSAAGASHGGHAAGGVLTGILVTLGPAIVVGLVTLVMSAAGCITYSVVTGRRKE